VRIAWRLTLLAAALILPSAVSLVWSDTYPGTSCISTAQPGWSNLPAYVPLRTRRLQSVSPACSVDVSAIRMKDFLGRTLQWKSGNSELSIVDEQGDTLRILLDSERRRLERRRDTGYIVGVSGLLVSFMILEATKEEWICVDGRCTYRWPDWAGVTAISCAFVGAAGVVVAVLAERDLKRLESDRQ